MYDMILPADQLEIAAIRGRLNCDEDTAVLTIFERRNRLINNYTCGAPRNGGGQYPPVSKSALSIYFYYSFINLHVCDASRLRYNQPESLKIDVVMIMKAMTNFLNRARSCMSLLSRINHVILIAVVIALLKEFLMTPAVVIQSHRFR